MATSPCERVKFQEGHAPPVHDLPGFYPSVEPRHARPETLGPDTAGKSSRNPSFAFDVIIMTVRRKSHENLLHGRWDSTRGEVWARKAGGVGNVTRGKREEKEDLLNACLALQPAHIFYDLIDISGGHAFDLRHIAELPMVRLDAVGRSSLEGRIPVMIRLIYFVH